MVLYFMWVPWPFCRGIAESLGSVGTALTVSWVAQLARAPPCEGGYEGSIPSPRTIKDLTCHSRYDRM
jgi:hypothetical protein